MKYVALLLFTLCNVTGCTNTALDYLADQPDGVDVYHTELAQQYRLVAEAEQQAGQFDTARLLAEKGVGALNGDAVMLETVPSDSAAGETLQGTVREARMTLERLMHGDAAARAPFALAKAIPSYDCLVVRVERGASDAELAQCQQALERAMTLLHEGQGAPVPLLTREDVANPKLFILYFDWNRAELNEIAMQNMALIAAHIRSLAPSFSVTLNGHADSSGTQEYNLSLSERRAQSVATILRTYGVADDAMMVMAFGESDLAVDTGDGVKEPKNRRVELIIE